MTGSRDGVVPAAPQRPPFHRAPAGGQPRRIAAIVVTGAIALAGCTEFDSALRKRPRPRTTVPQTTAPKPTVAPTSSTTLPRTVSTTTAPAITTTTAPAAPPVPGAADPDGWKSLQLGAGGWVTGIDFSDDGVTKVIRTDTYGGYRWDGSAWKQLVTASSMPAEDRNTEASTGTHELLVAPNDHDRLYMVFNGAVYRSDDRGDHWTKTSMRLTADANDPQRTMSGRMAVDPANRDVVYLATTDGLYRTVDGGATWAKIPESSVPKGTTSDSGTMTGLAFDRSSGTTGGRTRTVWVAARGRGVYRTTDAGASWSAMGGPTTVSQSAVSTTGVFYATASGRLWRHQSGAWADISRDGRWWHSVAVDPRNPNRVLASDDGGDVVQSTNGGASWAADAGNGVTRTATDIPWLGWTNENYMSNGMMRFDPQTHDKVWFAQGIGVWQSTFAATANAINWVSQSAGIDQLVVTEIIDTPGGQPLVGVWDRSTFRITNPDSYPTQHSPSPRFNSSWSLDWSGTDPNFVVANTSDHRMCCNGDGLELQAGWSSDGGVTWNRFATMPMGATRASDYGFGSIAVSTPDNIVWVPSWSRMPYYTKNRGATWQPVNLPGLDPNNGTQMSGFNWGLYLTRHNVVADKVNPGTFWIYNDQLGLYRTTNGGDTWTLVKSGQVTDWSFFNFKMRSVPGKAGHLFATSGTLDGGVVGAFRRSTDGGVTWTNVAGVMEVHAFGFGKAAAGSSYPTIFIAGWVNGDYGIWQSNDNAVTWSKIGTFPMGELAQVSTVEGDKDVFGRVYVGTGGNGAFYRG